MVRYPKTRTGEIWGTDLRKGSQGVKEDALRGTPNLMWQDENFV